MIKNEVGIFVNLDDFQSEFISLLKEFYFNSVFETDYHYVLEDVTFYGFANSPNLYVDLIGMGKEENTVKDLKKFFSKRNFMFKINKKSGLSDFQQFIMMLNEGLGYLSSKVFFPSIIGRYYQDKVKIEYTIGYLPLIVWNTVFAIIYYLNELIMDSLKQLNPEGTFYFESFQVRILSLGLRNDYRSTIIDRVKFGSFEDFVDKNFKNKIKRLINYDKN